MAGIGQRPDSADGLSPDLWGASFWKTVHYIAAGFPSRPTPHDRDHFRAFIAQLPHVLPCDECKQHSVRLLAQLPPNVNSRDQLFDWSVEFHNRVNDRIGAPRISANEARAAYGLPPQHTAQPVVVTPVPQQAPVQLGPGAQVQRAGQPRVAEAGPQQARVTPRYVPPRHMGYNPSTMGHNQSRQFYSRPATMAAPPAHALPAPAGHRTQPMVTTNAAPHVGFAKGLPPPPSLPRSLAAPVVAPVAAHNVPGTRFVNQATTQATNRSGTTRSKCNCGKK